MRWWRVILEHRRPLFRSGISLDVQRETMSDLADRDKIDVGQLCDPRGNTALNIRAIHFGVPDLQSLCTYVLPQLRI